MPGGCENAGITRVKQGRVSSLTGRYEGAAILSANKLKATRAVPSPNFAGLKWKGKDEAEDDSQLSTRVGRGKA